MERWNDHSNERCDEGRRRCNERKELGQEKEGRLRSIKVNLNEGMERESNTKKNRQQQPFWG